LQPLHAGRDALTRENGGSYSPALLSTGPQTSVFQASTSPCA